MKDIREQILDILGKYMDMDWDDCADEILALPLYPKEFIMWLSFGSHPFVPFSDINDGKLEHWYTDEISIHFTLDELYEYWKKLPK